jgi:hydroxylamine dehydrogenase
MKQSCSRRPFRLGLLAAALAIAPMLAPDRARADIPDALYTALGLEQGVAANVLYDALVARYRDPAQGAGKGQFADLWEPIPFSIYTNPTDFYEGPEDLDFDAARTDCVTCHETVTPGWVHSWKGSVHGNLDEIRALGAGDSRFYKAAMTAEVEGNLRAMGLLGDGQPLAEVGCIDCHMGVGAEAGNHKADLRMPDAAACGQCHVTEFAERESERDTLTWPQDQWPAGRPSHALSYLANVETAIWVGMEQREVAEGCTLCHTMQNTCNSCHTRHEFSASEARKPEACSTCHNGVDHNEFENFMLSKHGVIYQASGDKWDWDLPLEQAFAQGGQTAPTCQTCHMENNGEYSHNLVRKVRWGFNPMQSIADNLDHPWFEERKEAWIATCSQCHSPRFANTYFEVIDKGTTQGIALVEEARSVMNQLYDDGLLVGQKTNRPAPPAPDSDSAGAFAGLFFTKGNFPSALDFEFAEMWEQKIMRHFKGLAHANPGGWTYSHGWSELVGSLAKIQDGNTQLREKAALEERIKALEAK